MNIKEKDFIEIISDIRTLYPKEVSLLQLAHFIEQWVGKCTGATSTYVYDKQGK